MRETPRKFSLDMPVRWNSTYLMLKTLLPYISTISIFVHTHYQGQTMLTNNHWYVAQKIADFLEVFKDCTCILSGVYYPTCSLIVHHILEMVTHLNNNENYPLLRDVILPMKSKFLKY